MKKTLALLSILLLSACATVPGENPDPMESMNRQIFAFNEVVDAIIFEPVAKTYRAITPEVARKGIRNAFRNYYEPVTMANSLLQGDAHQFFTSFWRFILNTTLGFGGVYDFAGEYGGLPYRREDFGQTIAIWSNTDESDYLVLPFIGPSTARDAFGRVVDIFLDPFNYGIKAEESIAVAVGDALAAREALIDPIDDVYETSFDPYATIRSGYLQQRKAAISNRNSR